MVRLKCQINHVCFDRRTNNEKVQSSKCSLLRDHSTTYTSFLSSIRGSEELTIALHSNFSKSIFRDILENVMTRAKEEAPLIHIT